VIKHYKNKGKTKMKISVNGNQAFLFDSAEDGLMLCAAFGTQVYDRKEKKEVKMKNEFEMIVNFLKKNGMDSNMDRLMALYKAGLTFEKAVQVYERNKERYGKYDKGFAAFHFFVADVLAAKDETKIRPYAVNEDDVPY
jgi:hypothetical protein